MTIYITGPITGLPDGNMEAFRSAQVRLERAGYTVINPHELCSDIPPSAKHEVFMERCRPAVLRADAIVALPGYSYSKGAMMEHGWARAAGIPLYSVDCLEGAST